MGYDVISQFVNSKSAYTNMRGGQIGSGKYVLPPKGFPHTTWADALLMFSSFIQYTDTGEAADFVHTSDFEQAKKNWYAASPLGKYGLSAFAKVGSNEIYPHNEEFWGLGLRYAIARSAAGTVRTRLEIVKESIGEAVKELPETLQDAVVTALPVLSVPNLTLVGDLLKWSSIGGGLFMLYWYGLRR